MIYHFNRAGRAPLIGLSGAAALLWLGVLIGVSFLATPVKFQAPSLDLPTALDVGRVTFALSSRVEWGLWALLVLATGWSRPGLGVWALVLVLGGALAVQTFWLLPVLDERVGRIIAGLPVESAPHHLIYVAVEGGKGLALLSVAGLGWRRI